MDILCLTVLITSKFKSVSVSKSCAVARILVDVLKVIANDVTIASEDHTKLHSTWLAFTRETLLFVSGTPVSIITAIYT